MASKIIIALRRTYHCEHARTVLAQNALDYPVYELDENDSERSIQILRRAIQQGAQILITGDVYAGSILNQLDISVVTIRRSKIPFAESIQEALRLSERAAIVWRDTDAAAARKACRQFENLVAFYPYQGGDDLDQIFPQILAAGCGVIIGARTINPYAEKYGLAVVNVPYDESDILSAVRLAEHNLKSLEEKKEQAQIMRTIQDNISEGILSINASGMIQMANRPALKMLSMSADMLEGKRVMETPLACPEIERLITNFTGFSEKIITIHGESIVLEGNPIFVHSVYRSAVITMTLVERIRHTEQQVRRHLLARSGVASVTFQDIVGESRELMRAVRVARRYAAVDSAVLVYGQSGTGKEMFVQSIHNASKRKNGPFVVINCAALPEDLIESELFGYDKGAFTGALSGGKEGLFVSAHQGTVFLDEVSEMPLHVQARFLRVLQEHEVTPVGSPRVIPVDIRVIAATNKDLRQLVREKQFREDLYYRISILSMRLPDLREREGDIPLLIQHFIRQKNRELGLTIHSMDSDALAYCSLLAWPGNIRQLSNIVERSMVLSSSDHISLETVQLAAGMMDGDMMGHGDMASDFAAEGPLQSMDVLQDEIIRSALERNHNNRKQTAQELGISTSTLYRRMHRQGGTARN